MFRFLMFLIDIFFLTLRGVFSARWLVIAFAQLLVTFMREYVRGQRIMSLGLSIADEGSD